MRKIVGTFLTALVFAAPGYAQPWPGPFGLEMGLSKEKIGAAVVLTPLDPKNRENEYIAEAAPTPNGLFNLYRYRITPRQGLCHVAGIGKDQSSGVARREYDLLVSALVEKYGAPSHADGDSTTWLTAGDSGGLDRIIAARPRKSGGKSSLLLGYWFENYEACSAAPSVIDKSGL